MQRSSKSLDGNIAVIKERLKDCGDIIYKEFNVGEKQNIKLTAVMIDGMVDKPLLDGAVFNALMIHAREVPPDPPQIAESLYELIRYGALPAMELKEVEDLDAAILAILSGDAILLIDGIEKIIVIGSKMWPARGVSEPATESVIRGPRDGFTETFRFNTALVRRRIRDTKLKLKQRQVGRRSHTDLGIFYIEDIALPELVEEVERRLDTIDIDAILESGYIEQLIQDDTWSPFPQMRATERPDEVAAELYEGKVAILVDNSPFALILPATFNNLFHSPEDHYDRWITASLLRLIRFAASIMSLTLPALYIAVTTYDPGIIPTKLMISIAASRQGVPFPALVEALLMELTLELLREAGLRLPVAIGNTIGIVGGLVIGQAAVEAGIVSPIMVIVVGITAISSFSIPNYYLSVGFRLLRFGLLLLAGILGLYGVVIGLLLVLCHMAKLKSFGMPYLTPYAAFSFSDLKDTIIRVPRYMMKTRPSNLTRNRIRMKNNRDKITQEKGAGKDDQE